MTQKGAMEYLQLPGYNPPNKALQPTSNPPRGLSAAASTLGARRYCHINWAAVRVQG